MLTFQFLVAVTMPGLRHHHSSFCFCVPQPVFSVLCLLLGICLSLSLLLSDYAMDTCDVIWGSPGKPSITNLLYGLNFITLQLQMLKP